MHDEEAGLRLAWREERLEETLFALNGDRIAPVGPFVARVSRREADEYVWSFGIEHRYGMDVWFVLNDMRTHHVSWQRAAQACEAAVEGLVRQMECAFV